jgi:ABC-type multidrug transport system, ATPase component
VNDIIKIKNLCQEYGTKIALNNLNVTIEKGEIVGLLGHNGAGKSTIIKNLVSILRPTSGTITIDGLDLDIHRQTIKQKISYVPDTSDLFLQLTAEEYWDLIAVAYKLTNTEKESRVQTLGKLFNVLDYKEKTIESFSHGMRQKVIIVGSLLADPDIWILDEPLQGLDPQAAFLLKKLMCKHVKKGKTVIFSTHVLETAQQLCDKLIILKNGEILYDGSVIDLLISTPETFLETIYLNMTEYQ